MYYSIIQLGIFTYSVGFSELGAPPRKGDSLSFLASCEARTWIINALRLSICASGTISREKERLFCSLCLGAYLHSKMSIIYIVIKLMSFMDIVINNIEKALHFCPFHLRPRPGYKFP